MSVKFGIDVFLQRAADAGGRVAFVTNHAATTAHYVPSRKALRDAGLKLARLFSPEHGLDAVGDDGHPMMNGRDALTGIPIVSLYGDKLQPSSADLADIDKTYQDFNQAMAENIYIVPMWYVDWTIGYKPDVKLTLPKLPDGQGKPLFVYGRIPVHGLSTS